MRWIYLPLMRHLNLGFEEIGWLTYPQANWLIEGLVESGKIEERAMKSAQQRLSFKRGR